MNLVPFSPKQIFALCNSNKPYNLWTGAVRSGKTTLSIPWLINKIITLPDGYGMITGQTQETIERNFLNDLMLVLGAGNYRYVTGKYLDVYYRCKEEDRRKVRRMYIVGLRDKGAIRRIRGSTLVLLYMDEASLTPKDVFDELLNRLSVKGATALFTTNPDSPYHYLMREYIRDRYKKKDWQVFNFMMEDNLSLDREYKERLKRQYRGLPSLYQRMIEGKWVIAEGLVYNMYSERVNVIDEVPSQKPRRYYVFGDYGVGNPTVFLLVGEYRMGSRKQFIVLDEYYHSGRDTGRNKTTSKLLKDFEKLIERNNIRRIQDIILDPSASPLITEFESNGYMVTRANNEVITGIATVAQLLENGDIMLLKDTTIKTQEEFTMYSWDENAQNRGEDKPLKQNDHCLDALRYGIYTLIGDVAGISSRNIA